MNAKISVITVCYNSEKTIAETIKSVLSQTYRPLEYIIIDGNSHDRTKEIIKSYYDDAVLNKVDMTVVSEEDSGIYDAMNKGIDMAEGEWINFMNSDDRFHSADAIETIFSRKRPGYDVLYGDELVKDADGRLILNKRNADMSKITKSLPFCHQSSFTRTSLYRKYHFDTAYRYIADMDFFLKLYFWEKTGFQYIGIPVAEYYGLGVSNANVLDAFKEGRNLRTKYKYPGNVEWAEKIMDIYRYLHLMLLKKEQNAFINGKSSIQGDIMMDNRQIFTDIYKNKIWGGVRRRWKFYSGSGSRLKRIITPYCRYLNEFIKLNHIRSVTEIGCGDFYIMNKVLSANPDVMYYGYDVVDKLIAYNSQKFDRPNWRFLTGDAVREECSLQKADLLIIRQVLQHLDNRSVEAVLNKSLKFRYTLITELVTQEKYRAGINTDKPTDHETRTSVRSGVYICEKPFNMKYVTNVLEYTSKRDRDHVTVRTNLVLGKEYWGV